MTVSWIFSREGEQVRVDLVRTSGAYLVRVRHPDGREQRILLASLLHAILQQARIERRLTSAGWHLADFRRLPL